jgi:hypothetical protein
VKQEQSEDAMYLHCSFEELTALASTAERVLAAHGSGELSVAAPPRALADLEALAPRLAGEISIPTLHVQRSVQRALELALEETRARMDAMILEYHPAAEDAIAAYFDYAHILSVLERVTRMGAEMTMLIEVMTGRPVDDETARSFSFPD